MLHQILKDFLLGKTKYLRYLALAYHGLLSEDRVLLYVYTMRKEAIFCLDSQVTSTRSH